MITLTTRSHIYKFMTRSYLGKEAYGVPDNLCPFIRRFLAYVLATITMAFVVSIAVGSLLFFLVAVFWYRYIESSFSFLFILLGGVELLGLLVLGFWYSLVYIDHRTEAVSNLARKGDHAVVKAVDAVASSSVVAIISAWMRAAHDKVCPSIHITHDRSGK